MLVNRPYLSLIVSGRREWLNFLLCTNVNIQRPLGKHKDCRLDPLVSTAELQELVHRFCTEGRFGRLPHRKCNWLTVQWATTWSTSSLCAINPMCNASEWSNAMALNVAFGATSRICGSGTSGKVAFFSSGRFVIRSKWSFKSNLLLACYYGCNDTFFSEPIQYRKFWGLADTNPIPAQFFFINVEFLYFSVLT